MQRAILAVVVLSAGCRFHLDPLPGGTSPTPADDLAVGSDVDFAVGGDEDMAGVVVAPGDMAAPPGADLSPDPCANPPSLASGDVAAQCVVGDPPMVDGNLADWPTSLFQPMTHSTTGVTATGTWSGVPATDDVDLSARWAVRWDTTNVYVAVSVTDDIRQTPNMTYLTNNDCIELFFDGMHDRSISYAADDWQLAYSADGKVGVYQNGTAASLPNGIVVAKALGGTSPNWTLEVAVPFSLLGVGANLGREIGFDFKLDDNDSGTTMRDRDLLMFYVPGSGGGNCSAPYCRTDAFGTVQLLGR